MPAYFLSPALVRLRLEVNTLWPNRSKASDGWIGDTAHSARKSDHNPDYSAGGIVRAIDVTNDGINVDKFVSCVIRDVRTRYVITRGRIWTRESGWQAYSGSNGHYHHVHVSVRSVGSYDLQVHSWGLASTVANNISGGGSVKAPAPSGGTIRPPEPVDPLEQIMSYYRDRADFEGHVKRLAGEAVKEQLQNATFTDINGNVQRFNSIWQFRTGKAEGLLAQVLAQALNAKPGSLSDDDVQRLVDAIPDNIADRVLDGLGNRLKG